MNILRRPDVFNWRFRDKSKNLEKRGKTILKMLCLNNKIFQNRLTKPKNPKQDKGTKKKYMLRRHCKSTEN